MQGSWKAEKTAGESIGGAMRKSQKASAPEPTEGLRGSTLLFVEWVRHKGSSAEATSPIR